MNENEFKQLLSQKENKDHDYKLVLPEPKKIAQLVVAFYNSRGGRIVLGVEDGTRKPIGLDDAEKTEHKFVQIIRHWCKLDQEPDIEFVKYDGKDFVVVHCPKGEDTPYFVRGEYVPRVRIGSSNMPANKEEIARLYREGSSKSQDVNPVENATLEDIDLQKVKEYFKESKLTEKLDDDFFRLMEKEHFVARENENLIPTTAGLVLFGKHPSLEMPSTIIRADRYKGLDVSMWIDRADLGGDAFALVDDARKFMLKNMRTSYTPKGFKTEIKTEYPIEALKEAIINAVVHRDYHIRESILIKMFDDRVEIWSPGELLRPLTISQLLDLTYSPKSRNDTIANVFSKRSLMDKRGTGILRMNKFCDEYNLPHPVFVEQTDYFGIIFKNPDYYTKAPEIKVELNDRQRKAIDLIEVQGEITRREYMLLNKVSNKTAYVDLSVLVNKNIIKIVGKGRSTKYVLG